MTPPARACPWRGPPHGRPDIFGERIYTDHGSVIRAYARRLLILGLDDLEVGALVDLRGEYDCLPAWGSRTIGTPLDAAMPWRRRAWSSLVHDGILEERVLLYPPTSW